MPLDIDGAAVLKAIINAPDVFKDVDKDLNDFAHKVIVKQLKARGANVDRLRSVYRAIGEGDFNLIVDSLPDAGKSLLTKIDKHHPELKAAQPDWLRKHLRELARGTLGPAAKPARGAKESAIKRKACSEQKQKATTKRAISVEAFAAKWDGQNRDE